MRVLVIDDDPIVLDLVRLMLKDRHETLTARNASEGLGAVAGQSVDLILLDWMMPGTDGLTLLADLKSDHSTCDIRVIFLSGKISEEEVEQAIEAGAEGYISKPFSRKDLLRQIEKTRETESGKMQ